MSNEIEVVNQALAELDGGRIQSFADGTSVAQLCAELYPLARDMTLELHPWNFAMALARLARSPDTPVMKWTYMYPLPAQPWCIKVRGTDQGNGAVFEVGTDEFNGRVLYSDDASVSIEYTKRVEDLGSWSPLAVQVLVKVLASKLAKPLTGQNSTEDAKWKQALALLPEGKASDGREGSPYVLRANTTLTMARRGWGVLGSTVVEG